MTSIARDNSKVSAAAWACIAITCAVACGKGTVPRPAAVQVVSADYIAVPFTPRPPPVEIVPPRPAVAGSPVWADGGWEWNGERYRWDPGAWVIPPAGTKRARWVIVRREGDGQLFFAPSSWRDASGKAIEAPKPLARARTRPGNAGASEGGEASPPAPSGSAVLDD